MASTAVGSNRVSTIVGYKLKKGNFAPNSPNLPQRIAILGEANEDNQSSLSLDPVVVSSAQEAGQLYGYGSPIHHEMLILRPENGDGVGAIETVVYPQAKAVGATQKIMTITASGVATGNGTHTIMVAGRNGKGGVFYDIAIVTGDTAGTIAAKIADAINAVLGSPVTAVANPYLATLTTKWAGLTAQGLTLTVDTGDSALGLTYAINVTQAGSGTPSVQGGLDKFLTAWNTIVLNSYGTDSGTMQLLEAFNGKPDPTNPTGRYAGIVFKPFIAITGSVAEDPSAITDARLNEQTIAIAPAPLSPGFQFEAAANAVLLYALQAQDTPELDIQDMFYPDMPIPSDKIIGAMSDYNNRDVIVKKGCSTAELNGDRYQIKDFVTTYHPVGENPPQYRYVRTLNIDFNVRFGYYLLEQLYVVGHVIANDGDTVDAPKVVKPKTWKQQVRKYASDLVLRGLTVDAPFMQNSLTVVIASNPDRLNSFFRYKRSGFARISSTDAEAGFNQGTLN